jgi:hypothetical protein
MRIWRLWAWTKNEYTMDDSIWNFKIILLTPLLNIVNLKCRHLIIFNGAIIFKVDATHMLVKTLCTCSCGMVLMMHVRMSRLPIGWISDCQGNRRRRRIWVASRFLTTKIPSALLVAVVWLQHTRCPRFRRDTFGYGITTSPTREAEYEYGVFMRMHVRIPKLPKCICHVVHAQNQHF